MAYAQIERLQQLDVIEYNTNTTYASLLLRTARICVIDINWRARAINLPYAIYVGRNRSYPPKYTDDPRPYVVILIYVNNNREGVNYIYSLAQLQALHLKIQARRLNTIISDWYHKNALRNARAERLERRDLNRVLLGRVRHPRYRIDRGEL